jgi:hypothetical protein
MSDFIRIFCQSNTPVTRRQIATFIIDGVFFDDDPRFEPPLASVELDNPNWEWLDMYYQAEKRPIQFYLNVADSLAREEIEEVQEALVKAGAPQDLIERIASSQQTIAIEIIMETLPEDAWDMLASIEAYLAQTLQGIIYASDDGLYDAELQLLYKL